MSPRTKNSAEKRARLEALRVCLKSYDSSSKDDIGPALVARRADETIDAARAFIEFIDGVDPETKKIALDVLSAFGLTEDAVVGISKRSLRGEPIIFEARFSTPSLNRSKIDSLVTYMKKMHDVKVACSVRRLAGDNFDRIGFEIF